MHFGVPFRTMLILSASTSISGAISKSRASASLNSSSSGISHSSGSVLFRFGARVCPCLVLGTRKTGLVEDKESIERVKNVGAIAPKKSSFIIPYSGGEKEFQHSRPFLDVESEEELLSSIRKETEAKRLPSNVAVVMEELYQNYKNAVFQSGNPIASEIVLSNMAVTFDRIFLDVEEPFTFSPHHKAIREPFDYYLFGQNYIRPLIDFRRSYVGNISLFSDMEEKLKQGHNIVLISNHQTEADPAVIALLLETTNPDIAEKMTYVAGDRVVTDPICKPFSMGRNLLCVYSKKHMHDIPALAEMKRRANTQSLKEMTLLFRTGAQLIWIAPSGGRDRPDPSTGKWSPAPFDTSSVDNIRRLLDHSGVPGHIYPLALVCHDIMPPPPQVEKDIGERRMISFHGVGLSVAPEISFKDVATGHENLEEAKAAFSEALYSSILDQYDVLNSAIYGNKGLSASNHFVSLSQPWE